MPGRKEKESVREPTNDPGSERDVHAQIAAMARELHNYEHSDFDTEAMLSKVTHLAVDLLDEVNHAGITLVTRGGTVCSTAATGPIPARIDAVQDAFRDGPCVRAIWDHETVRVQDFRSETRWPAFVEQLLAQTPVLASLSVRLYTSESDMGALNLYSESVGVFDERAEDTAVALGAHAAIALSGARRSDQFHSALLSRDIIGRAKGIIMERYKINAVAAFTLLTKLSQENNEPVAKIARQLVEADFPPTP